MDSNPFSIGVAVRVCALAATIALLSWMVQNTQWYVTIGLTAGATLGQVWMLIHYATQSSRAIARFLDSLAFDDTSPTFSATKADNAFHDLSLAMTSVLDRLRAGRLEREEQAQYLQALIAHVPVALLTVDHDGAVQLLNTAARKLFEGSCDKASEFSRYGEAFAAGMKSLAPGESVIIQMERASGLAQLKAAATGLAIRGTRRRLISLQNIGTELTAQELAAWEAVVRVMAHEVMNSLTPISSLAATARGLMHDVLARIRPDDPNNATLADAGEALDIMAQRSEGLMRFLQNHRRLTRRMVVKRELVPLAGVLVRLRRLLATELESRNIELLVSVEPETLELSIDPELLDQMLLNLARNSMEALRERSADLGRIAVSAYREQDNHVVIVFADNGPGIPQELRQKVFVPFFTTKRQGSGVGLTLVRQIVALHGGMVGIAETPGGGATIRLRF
jgi:two-component system, NtrC family, nitrogen regulation sensor histidine kinase NtrY